MDSAESAGGRLGAVLSSPRSGAVALGPHGPWLATDARPGPTGAHRHRRLRLPRRREPHRRPVGQPGRDPVRPRRLSPRSAPTSVARGRRDVRRTSGPRRCAAPRPHAARTSRTTPCSCCAVRWPRDHDRGVLPVARRRRTATAVADLVLDWIDALGPVIAARASAGRWSRVRRAEQRTRASRSRTCSATPSPRTRRATRQQAATVAGRRHPGPHRRRGVAARLARQPPDGRCEPATRSGRHCGSLRPPGSPPASRPREVDLGGATVPQGRVVLVSPLLLGRLSELVPGDPGGLAGFDAAPVAGPQSQRPGAWLPFGAGPHACPGRTPRDGPARRTSRHGGSRTTLTVERTCDASTRVGASRPLPCRFTVAPRSERVHVIEHPALQDTVGVADRRPPRRRGLAASDPRPATSEHRRGFDLRGRALADSSRASRSSPSVLTELRPGGPRAAGTGSGGRAWVREWARRALTRRFLPPPGAGPEAALTHAVALAPRPHRRGRAILDRDLLPPEADQDRAELARVGVRSLVSVDVHVRGDDVRQPVRSSASTRAHGPSRSSQDFRLLNAALTARLTLEQSRRSLAEAIEAGAEAQLATSSSSARSGTSCVRRCPRSSATPRACSTTPSTGPPTTSRPA